MQREIIAIDGPAAAGKSTVGRQLAARLGWIFFDTGLLYRGLTLLAQERGIAVHDAEALVALVPALDLRVGRASVSDGRAADVWLGQRDVTWALQGPNVNRDVSTVAALAPVRAALVEPQRRAVAREPAVVVGRDMGTAIFPDAALKVYLDASPLERARRRAAEQTALGAATTAADALPAIQHRDTLDAGRAVAPLAMAPDAVLLDSDRLTVEEVVQRIAALWQARASRLTLARGEGRP